MRIIYYDCFAGISGDMHLAALIDLGLPPDHLRTELAKLGLAGWSLRLTPDAKNGIGGTRVDVDLDQAESESQLDHDHPHSQVDAQVHHHDKDENQVHHHHHDAGHHDHSPSRKHEHNHDETHSQAPGNHGTHRNYRDIMALIKASSLSEEVKRLSLAIFERVAIAESAVHGVPLVEVAFHEVGAVDSIIDIVGGAIGIDWFKPDRILASPPELGGGMVRCAHGLLPVPAPATVAILRGIPVRSGAVPFEMTTPTGAAILAATVQEFTESARMTIQKTGYGIGHRTVAIPNILRVHLAEMAETSGSASLASLGDCTVQTILECNIDDMSGENLGTLLDTLLSAGASDAWHTPIIMKKGRPAITVSILCDSGLTANLAELLLRETSSFGLRSYPVDKLALRRTLTSFDSSLGAVAIKTAWIGDRELKAKPEYADCQRLAAAQNRPVREIVNIIQGELDARRTNH